LDQVIAGADCPKLCKLSPLQKDDTYQCRDNADLLSNAQPISNEVNVIQQLLFN